MFPVPSWPDTAPRPTTVALPQRFYQQHQDSFHCQESNRYGHQPSYHPDNPILIQQLQGHSNQHYRNGIAPPGSPMHMQHHYPPPPSVSPYQPQSEFIPMGPPPPRASPVDRFTPNGFQNNRESIVISSPSLGLQLPQQSMQPGNYFPQHCPEQQNYLQNGFNRHAPSPVLYATLKTVHRPQRSPFPSASSAFTAASAQERASSPPDDSIQILEERPGKRHLQQNEHQSTEPPAQLVVKAQSSKSTDMTSGETKTEGKKKPGAPKVAKNDQTQQVVCPVDDCQKVMATRKTLERHFQIHVKTQDVHCPVCEKEFETPYKRGNHVFKVHQEYYPKYKAERDQDEYEVKIKEMCFNILKTHEMEQKSKAKTDVNRVVDEDEESRQSSVTSSSKNASGSDEGVMETNDGSVKRRGTGPLKCHICGPGKGYSSWKAYKRHWKTAHVKLEPDGGGVSCDFCQQTFKDLTTGEGYDEHCQAHCRAYVKERKIWLFDDDDEETEDTTELRIVQVTSVAPEVTSEMPSSYGQATTDTAELEKDKPFVCQVQGCVARFKRRQHLESHNIKHHGTGGSFECPIPSCGRRFVYKHDLKNHVRGIHKEVYDQTTDDGIRRGGPPEEQRGDPRTFEAPPPPTHNYRCIICRSTFIKLTGLQSHIRKVHPEEHETEFQYISKDQLKEMSKTSTTPPGNSKGIPPSAKRKSSTPSKVSEGTSPTSPGVPLFSSTRRSESLNSLTSLEPTCNSDKELDGDAVEKNTRSHGISNSATKRQKLVDDRRIPIAITQPEHPQDVYHAVNIKVLPYNQNPPAASGKSSRSKDRNTIVIQELPTPFQQHTAQTKAQFIEGCRFPILKVEPDVQIIEQLPSEQPNHQEILLCPDPKCSRSFSTKAKLKIHLKHKKSQKSKCKKCAGSWFHPYGKKCSYCPSCKKKLDEQKNRRAEERFKPSSWIKTIVIACFECTQQFSTEQALRSHLLVSHMDPPSEKECPTCSFMLEDAIEFWVHTRAHAFDRARPIDCTQETCQHRFEDNQNLQLHLQVYHGLAKEQLDKQASFAGSNTSSSTSNITVRKNFSDLCLADLLASSPCAPKIQPDGDCTPSKNSLSSSSNGHGGSARKSSSSVNRVSNSPSIAKSASKTSSPESKTSLNSSNASLSTPNCSATSDSSRESEESSVQDSQHKHASDFPSPIYHDSSDNMDAQKPDEETLKLNGKESTAIVNSVKEPEKITLKSSSLKSSDSENV